MKPQAVGPAPRRCPQCGAVATTRFCGECGYPLGPLPAPPEDLRTLVRAGAAEVLGLDRRLLATGRDLLLHPARVVAAHLERRAHAYVHPLKLFFFLGGLFMLCLGWLQPFSFAAVVSQTSSTEVNLPRVVFGAADTAGIRQVFAAHGLTEETADARFVERSNAATPVATGLALLPMALILGLLQRERPRRDHLTFLLVMSNAVWILSLLLLPIFLLSQTVTVVALNAGRYLYLAVGFWAIYGGASRVGTAARFGAFALSDVVVTSLVSLLLTMAILASIFYP